MKATRTEKFLSFKILCCYRQNPREAIWKKRYWTELSCGAVYYAVQGGSNFWVCGRIPIGWPFKWKLLNGTLYVTVYYAV